MYLFCGEETRLRHETDVGALHLREQLPPIEIFQRGTWLTCLEIAFIPIVIVIVVSSASDLLRRRCNVSKINHYMVPFDNLAAIAHGSTLHEHFHRPIRLVCHSRSVVQLTTFAVATRVPAALVVVRAASSDTRASVPEVGDRPLQENRENAWTHDRALR